MRLLEELHRVAMKPRRRELDDERDPLFLHPGRTALILLLDVGAADPRLLGASLLVDTARPELEPDDGVVIGAVGGADLAEDLLGLRRKVPRPPDPRLTEELVSASEDVRLLALAERLDHLRHAHLEPDREVRKELHRRASEVYAPVAERTHAILARRYAWWCRMFGSRWL